MKLTATDRYHSTPISRKLPSNFIELAFGFQENGLGAELFFNRSFERFNAYRLIYKVCSYMLEDDTDISSRYETDWRKLEWYHSGYEHDAWFAFPGTAGYQEVKDDATFIIEESDNGCVHIGLIGDGYHGRTAMKVVNDSPAGVQGGLAQDGKYLRPGVNYFFRGAARLAAGSACRGGVLTAAFFRDGTTVAPVCTASAGTVDGNEYVEIGAVLTVPEEGRYTFVLFTPGGTEYVFDDFSLTAEDSVFGFRKSAVDSGKYISPRVLRWPGGCFASYYNWRDGVGKKRVPGYSYFWNGLQYNDIGTDELVQYAKAIGGESMICVNMYHPLKRFWDLVPPEKRNIDPDDREQCPFQHGFDAREFTDGEQGARDAAAWVEYCNGGIDTEGGRMRAENGHPEPFGVQYWELDNEIHRWFGAVEYAEECVKYSKAMKAVDPSIRIGMVFYGFCLDDLKKMMEIAGKHIDFLADRGIGEADMALKAALLEDFNRSHGTDIRYCNTEWVPMNGADLYNMVPKSERVIDRCMIFSRWSYALEAASNLMTWQRYGQLVDFACFSAFADNHSQAVLETTKEGDYFEPSGMMMHWFAHTRAYRTLVIEDYLPARTDPVQVQLSEDETGTMLVLNILNRSERGDTLELDVSVFNVADGVYPGRMLWAPSLISTNSVSENGINEDAVTVSVENGILRAGVRALSFTEYLIGKGGGR